MSGRVEPVRAGALRVVRAGLIWPESRQTARNAVSSASYTLYEEIITHGHGLVIQPARRLKIETHKNTPFKTGTGLCFAGYMAAHGPL